MGVETQIEQQMNSAPNPGSDAAVELGCTCPVLDNSHGTGYMGSGQFWITEGCPLHDNTDVKDEQPTTN